MAYIKLTGFISIAICYILTSIPFYLWALIDRYTPRRYMTRLASFYAKLTLKLFGISFTTRNFRPIKDNKVGRLIVSNHMSYLDAVVMQAHNPSCFVTSMEMKKTPFLGQICEAGGCLYVERRSRAGLSEEIKDITNALKAGLDVVVFPEATSTNGEDIKRFKRPLFQAAIDSGAIILPQTINYLMINNVPVTTSNRDKACWYGEMSFFPHLIEVLSQRSFNFEIVLNQVIQAKAEELTSDLASKTEDLVKLSFLPIKTSTPCVQEFV